MKRRLFRLLSKTNNLKVSLLAATVIFFVVVTPQGAIALNLPNKIKHLRHSDLTLQELTKAAPAQVSANQENSFSKTKDADLAAKNPAKRQYITGEILVKYKNNKINLETALGREDASRFAGSKALENKVDIRKANISVLKIKDIKTVEQKIAELNVDANVEYAQPNYQYYPAAINTNDTNKDSLWGLDNTGQTIGGSVTGTNDADIDAPEAWAISEAAPGAQVIVAVIDTGVAYNHPDLVANMWNGTGCVDENGAVLGGCNHGYDYEDNDKSPLPTHSSHGTHVAGTVAAAINNGKGVIGVAPRAKIMAIKSSLSTSEIIKGIAFAERNGAKVINASWGGGYYDQLMKDAIASFSGLFIAAVGNNGSNNDSAHFYPSDYNLDNIVSVAATDSNDNLASFSNYGATSVDTGAPGANILSAIADSTKLNENFEELTPYNLPSGWIKGGSNNGWGTFDRTSTFGSTWGKVLYGDLNYPYLANVNTTVTSPTYDLSNATKSNISFWTMCDTSYHLNSEGTIFQDYMALEASADGVNFSELKKWNEFSIDIENQSGEDSAGWAGINYSLTLPDNYLTGNFKFRLRWVTDAVDNSYDGCLVDDINITKFSNGSDELYSYYSGTSMAAPHVSGLAALLWGYKPTLTTAEMKSTILNTGDPKTALAGKTVTGKRINAFNAINSLVPATHTISGTVKYYDGVKAVSGATVVLEDNVGTQINTATTDANGFYQFTGAAGGGNYVIRVGKNGNASGLTSADQIKIGRHIVGLEPFYSIYKSIAGDVNNSGGLTSADQIKIGRFIVGLDSVLASGVWKFYSSGVILTATNYLTVGPTRTIANLTADAPNLDFVGIKMGDVNNSWINN